MTSKPRLLTCYVCAREYGTKSIAIHIPQCRRTFEAREALKRDARDRQRCPDPPPGYMDLIDAIGASRSLGETLAAASLTPPSPGSLSTRAKGSLVVDAINDAAYRRWSDEVLRKCERCGRSFNPDAYTRHAARCAGKGLSPARRSARATATRGGKVVDVGTKVAAKPRSPAKAPRARTIAFDDDDDDEVCGDSGDDAGDDAGDDSARCASDEDAPHGRPVLSGVALDTTHAPSLGAVRVYENEDWYLARVSVPDCDDERFVVEISNGDRGDRAEIVVEGVVTGAADGAVERAVPVSISNPGVCVDSYFTPVLGPGTYPPELPNPGRWSRKFALPGPVVLELRDVDGRLPPGETRTHYKIVHQQSRTLELYFWKEKPSDVLSPVRSPGVDRGFFA